MRKLIISLLLLVPSLAVAQPVVYPPRWQNATTLRGRPLIVKCDGSTVTCSALSSGTLTISAVGGGGGSGTVTSIATTSPLSGGTITTSGTLSCPACLTGSPSALGDIMYSTSGGQGFTPLADVATTNVLLSGGVGAAPLWGKVANAALSNSSITVTTASPLGGAATVSLGSTLALTCSTCALTSTTITAGTGLSGGGDLSTNRTLSMPNVGPGAVTSTLSTGDSITTDAQGRVTAVTPNQIQWSIVDRANALGGGTSQAGQATVGTKFTVNAAATVTGCRFYWVSAGGSKTVTCTLWDSAGTNVKTVNVAVNATGVYTGTFASSYSLSTLWKGYHITTYETLGGFYSYYTNQSQGGPMPFDVSSWGQPAFIGPHVVLLDQGRFCLGANCVPNTSEGSANVSFPVEPVLTVP